jgi:hypothetical protein
MRDGADRSGQRRGAEGRLPLSANCPQANPPETAPELCPRSTEKASISEHGRVPVSLRFPPPATRWVRRFLARNAVLLAHRFFLELSSVDDVYRPVCVVCDEVTSICWSPIFLPRWHLDDGGCLHAAISPSCHTPPDPLNSSRNSPWRLSPLSDRSDDPSPFPVNSVRQRWERKRRSNAFVQANLLYLLYFPLSSPPGPDHLRHWHASCITSYRQERSCPAR